MSSEVNTSPLSQPDTTLIIKASLLIMLSAVLYGFMGFLGTVPLREHMPITAMLFWRFFFAFLWIIIFAVGFLRQEPYISKTSIKPFTLIFLLGAIGYAGASGLYFVASQFTGTGLAMVVFFSFPLIVAFFTWLKRDEKLTFMTVIGLLILIVGLLLLKTHVGLAANPLGLLFALLSASCYAFYVIGSKHMAKNTFSPTLTTAWVTLGCVCFFLFTSLLLHQWMWPQSMKECLDLLTLGVLATAIPIQLMLFGLQYVSALRASILSVFEPLMTVLMGVFFLNEQLVSRQYVGIGIILVSVIIVQCQKR